MNGEFFRLKTYFCIYQLVERLWTFLLSHVFLKIIQAEKLLESSTIDRIYADLLSNDVDIDGLMLVVLKFINKTISFY